MPVPKKSIGGNMAAIVRYKPTKRTKTPRTTPKGPRRKAYRGQGRP